MSVINLIKQVREDYLAHGRDWTKPGFQAIAVHRFGTWKKTLRTKVVRAPMTVLADTARIFVRNVYGIELPFEARIGRRVVIEHQHGIVVHGNCIIGNDCRIRQGVTLGIRRMTDLTAAPIVGDGVDIGAGAMILGSIKLGNHCKIGANAIVLRDVPAHATAVSMPAAIVPKD